jgi:transcription-repair coupling factor (superfamily II helicase)
MALTGLLSLLGSQEWMQRHLRNLAAAAARPSLTVQPDHQPVYLATLWHHAQRPVVAIAPRLEDARRLHDQLLTYLGEDAPVYLLPESEVLPFERLAVDARTINQRLAALAALAAYDTGDDEPSPPLVVASVSAACRLTLPPRLVAGRHPDIEHSNRLSVGARIHSLDNLLAAWVQLGYRHEPQVDTPGSFSLRGGILDVFPPDAELPYRIELWDDEVDTIRRFDPETQRSIEPVDEVRVIPAAEQLPDLVDHAAFDERRSVIDLSPCSAASVTRFQEELGNLLVHPNPESLSLYNGLLNDNTLADFLPADALVVFDRPARLAGESEEMEAKFAQQKTNRQNRGELPYGFPSPNTGWDSLLESFQAAGIATVRLERWSGEREDDVVQPVPDTLAGLENFTNDVTDQVGRGNAVVAVSQHASRLVEVLGEAGVKSQLVDTLPTRPRGGRVYVMAGGLRKGWQSPAATTGTAVTVFSDAELFGTVKERRYRAPRARRDLGDAISLADLTPGTYVVHIDHGVARFAGTTHLESAGEEREYLVLEYAGDDRLYVPTEQLDRIGAYVSANDYQPTLTRLGGNEWQRIKERARGAAREIAEELLRLYATRESIDGHRFGADAAWQRDLEDAFPYVETPDQLRAINEVKGDMEVSRPMDRLICGDVGYGKTEVALRAAFKAVNEGMQVAVLVPTTVLAQQHYATFAERLAPYPVNVEVLSRFRTHREQIEVVAATKEGNVDIVIGTHRILQKDVAFKNLGLVIVDEEHRFGVAHKERLKQMRAEVDVLTLSATPIPRTLHMALAGVRDMSVIHTPPEARLPVRTFVSEDSAELVREAILREMERDGQVFFLHNRVRTIHQVAEELSKLVPEARILVGHGQMPENELEDVMLEFSNRNGDVLVCTTIIESGLDMPNVNTIIIDRADRFGLAQLYQLRGRVGRGDHRAYAYLLLPDNHEITDAASQRIHAILEATELGAGFRVAMRDLEIRGAGNLLGADQSGQIHAVGLNLYSQLLHEAVEEINRNGAYQSRDEAPPPPRIDLPVPASIPEDYIAHLPARLAFYQRLSQITDRSRIADVRSDLEDRFGPLPAQAENLLAVTDLRCLGAAAGVESLTTTAEGFVTAVFRQAVGDARLALQKTLGAGIRVGRRDLEIRVAGDPDYGLARLGRALRRVIAFVEQMQEALAAAQAAAPAADSTTDDSPAADSGVDADGPQRGRRRRNRNRVRLPAAAD